MYNPEDGAVAAAPEAKQTAAAALPVGKPLSLAPDAHNHSAAATPPPHSHLPAGTATAAEASSGGRYAVAVASERSAADADAVFRSLQAKFPNQLGGRLLFLLQLVEPPQEALEQLARLGADPLFGRQRLSWWKRLAG
jgi:hypothetical protein